jgi:hypothetical protein
MSPATRRPVTDLLLALAGAIVWAAHFFGVYLAQALLCAHRNPTIQTPVSLVGALLTVLALAAMFAFAIRQHRGASDAALFFALPLTAVSAVGVVWTSLPLFLLPACAQGGA